MPIDKEKLREIDKAIDSEIEKFPLLKRSRDEAIIHLTTVYERYVTFESIEATMNITGHNLLAKNAQDGIDFAIQWIYKFCPNNSATNYKLKPKILKEAKQLLDVSIEYSRVWDYMTLLFRDMCLAEITDDINITLSNNPEYRSEADIANRFLNSTDDLNSTINEIQTFLSSDPQSIMEELNFEYSNNNLVYTLSDSAYVQLYKVNQDAKKHLMELEESWDLGGYTVRDFRRFYFYLRSITTAHMMGCMSMKAQRKEVFNHCIKKSKDEWLKNIGECLTIGEDERSKILSDLTYDSKLYGEGKKVPDITYQPFIEMKDGSLLLFNSIVQQSSFERNHWDLISIIRPELHSKLRNAKEKWWRTDLEKFCSSIGLKTCGPIEFSFENSHSDIDLAVINDNNKVMLLLELKWLTSPDRIKDVIYVSEEIKKGLDQVEFSLKYFNNSKEEAAQKISINLEEFKSYKIFGLVLSKNSMGNGFTYDANVPCVNERIFRSILGEPHKKTLEILWKVAKEQRYMPKENVHYKTGESQGELAGYKFTSKDSGMFMIRQFDLINDFNFEGL